MLGKSHAAHSSSPSAGRFDGDARQTRQRLLALDRRSGLRERGQETGDNTPWADAVDANARSRLTRSTADRARGRDNG